MGSQLSSLVPQKGSPRAHQTCPGRSSAAHQPITSSLPSRRSVSGAQAPTSLASSASAPTPTTRLTSQWTPAPSSSPPRPLELVVLPTSRSTRPRSDGRRADGLEQLGTDVCARHQPVSDVNALSVHCPSPDSRVSFILLPRALAQRRSPSPSSRNPSATRTSPYSYVTTAAFRPPSLPTASLAHTHVGHPLRAHPHLPWTTDCSSPHGPSWHHLLTHPAPATPTSNPASFSFRVSILRPS